MKKTGVLVITAFTFLFTSAQKLKPGFDKAEYIALMKVSAQVADSPYSTSLPPPQGYRFIYRSPDVGFENSWDLWVNNEGIPIISVRGTTVNELSWLANFYAAMVPAKGELQLSKTNRFTYQLADNPRAAVHVGWLVSMAYLSKTILPKIDSLSKTGAKEMFIMGHSQGGAIVYLLRAYLHHLQKQQLLPADIRFKTYCSAGPKPGNLYFAHEYEAVTRGGWAYNVVNAADWVPESPVTIQTLGDFTEINPFINTKEVIKKQSFFKRLALNYAYAQLTKPGQKAASKYRKYLGSYVVKAVKKQLPGFEEPKYATTYDYARAGFIISLLPDDDYYKQFPQTKENVFINHLHHPYLYLMNKYATDNGNTESSPDGNWELNYISGIKMAFEGLYPDKKPFINIDASTKKSKGNTSCNNFNATFTIDKGNIHFPETMAMTKMFCPGEGELIFLSALKTVSAYAVNENELTLFRENIAVMRFLRKP